MPPDPPRTADTRAWLAKAALDLRSTRADLAAFPPIRGDALFHCQQAVEKALKAWLAWHDRPFRKTHDLGELGGQAIALDPSLEPLLRQAAVLTEYAWQFRYPGEVAEPSEEETAAGVSLAERVVAAIVDRLPQDAHPTA
jgi:HEPN domain-containing protein